GARSAFGRSLYVASDSQLAGRTRGRFSRCHSVVAFGQSQHRLARALVLHVLGAGADFFGPFLVLAGPLVDHAAIIRSSAVESLEAFQLPHFPHFPPGLWVIGGHQLAAAWLRLARDAEFTEKLDA